MRKVAIIVGIVGMLYAGDTLVYVGQFDPGGRGLYDAWVIGDTAYLSAGGIIFLDITDRTNPQEINYFEMSSSLFIEVHDSLAYITRAGSNTTKWGLWIINVKDPQNPVIVGSLLTYPFYLLDLEVEDTLCYIASDTGLCIVNIKNPYSPELVTIFIPPLTIFNSYWYLRFHNDLILTNDFLDPDILHCIDVSDPSNPVLLDTLPVPATNPFIPNRILGIHIYSHYAYCGADTGLWIVDISNPSNLQTVNIIPAATQDVWVMDTFLFAGSGPRVWRLTPDPTSPEPLAQGGLIEVPDIFADTFYYIYCIADRGNPYPWKIYQFKEVGIKEKKSKNKEYLNFEISKNGIKIFYDLLFSQYGKIYITDKSGRILKVLKKGILRKGEIFWESQTPGTYFLILETKEKKIRRKIEILK